MLYTPMVKKAMHIAYQAHMHQVDKGGMPYIFHPFHLAEAMETEETVITALLHDVCEDTGITPDDLKAEGFSEAIIKALVLLTRAEDEDYFKYIQKLKLNPTAKAVKIADLYHNSDLSRLDTVDEKAQKRREKYLEAIALLESAD